MSGKFKEVSDELKGNKYTNHRGEVVEVLNVVPYGRGVSCCVQLHRGLQRVLRVR